MGEGFLGKFSYSQSLKKKFFFFNILSDQDVLISDQKKKGRLHAKDLKNLFIYFFSFLFKIIWPGI